MYPPPENEFGNDYNDEFQLNSPLRVPIKGSTPSPTPTPTDDINDKMMTMRSTNAAERQRLRGFTLSPTPTPTPWNSKEELGPGGPTDDIDLMRSTSPAGSPRVPSKGSGGPIKGLRSPINPSSPSNSHGPLFMDARKPGDYAVMEYGVPAPDIMEYGVRWPTPPPPPSQVRFYPIISDCNEMSGS